MASFARVVPLVAVLGLFSVPALAAPRCERPNSIALCPDCETRVRLRAQPNGVCRFGSTGADTIISRKVLRPPQQGIYGIVNLNTAAFRANPEAVGQDYFEVEIVFERNGRRFRNRQIFEVSYFQ